MNKKTTPKPVTEVKAKPRKKPKVLTPQNPRPAWTPPVTECGTPAADSLNQVYSESLSYRMHREAKADRSVMAHTADTLAEVTRKLEDAEDDVRRNKMYYEKSLTNAMNLQAKYDRLLLILSQ